MEEPSVAPSEMPSAAAPDTIPLPPGLPPLAPAPRRLVWWQGLLAMLVALGMLIVANLAVALAVLLAQVGPEGLGALAADSQRTMAAMTTFPALAAGQFANLFVFAVIALVAPLAARVPHRSALGLGGAPPSTLLLAAVGILGLSPLADRIVTTLKPYFPQQSSLEMIEAAVAGQPLWLLVPVLAVMPALGEEALCRGVLQRSLGRPAVALPVSALFFSALHFDPLHMAGVLPLGFYLAWLGHRTGSLWVPVSAHFSNNLVAVLALHFRDAGAATGIAGESELPLYAVPLGIACTLVTAFLIHARMRARETLA